MSNKPYIIEGCKSSSGVYPRLEISDLQKNPKQFSLFVQAVTNIMRHDYKYKGSDAVNWEQLAGIHGMPYKEWSGDVKGTDPQLDAQAKGWQGYCHHRDVLFPTWHRVVVLLVEQAVFNEAKVIVDGITGVSDAIKEEWKTAADQLRFPYWDWTTPPVEGSKTYFPEIFKSKEISILGFDGKTGPPVFNPLYTYKFGEIHKTFPDDEQDKSFFSSWDRTYRRPTGVRDDPEDQYDRVDDMFLIGDPTSRANNVTWLRNKVAHLFTYRTDLDKKWGGNAWDYFSNIRYGKPHQSASPYDNMPPAIEEPHDSVHIDIGGNGHMGDNDVAGFDPIFYLHHCNIDRIFAFWEYVYPSYWVGEGWYDPKDDKTKDFVDVLGTYTEDTQTPISQSSGLTPFRKTETAYWASRDVHGLQPGQGAPKHYTYPAIVHGKTKVQVDVPFSQDKQAEYISALQKSWGLGLSAVKDSTLPIVHAPIFHRSPTPPKDSHTIQLHGLPEGYQAYGKYRIFVVVVTVAENAYKGSFRIELHPRSAPQVIINRVSFLRRSTTANCAACVEREAANTLVRSTMILDPADIRDLIHGAGLNNKDAADEDVVNLLKASFEARVVSPNGTILAETHPDLSDGAEAKVLDNGAPELHFYSASISHPENNPGGHVQFYDWIKHTTLVDSWVDRR